MKSYRGRTSGSEVKFKRDDTDYPLESFANDCFAHMEEHGLDTFFYMKGVDTTGAGGQDLFHYHTSYTSSVVASFISECTTGSPTPGMTPCGIAQLDSHGLSALRDSGTYLLNSLDETLKSSLRPLLPPRPCGPTVWMAIVDEVEGDSIRRLRDCRTKFEALTVAQFRGENVADYAKAAFKHLQPLERHNKLEPDDLLTIIDQLCKVSVQDFKIPWMTRRTAVEDYVREVSGKDASVIAKLPNRMTYHELLERAKKDYQNLQQQWSSAGLNDKKNNPVQALQSKLDQLDSKLNKVSQGLSVKTTPGKQKLSPGKDGKPRRCFDCNSEYHLRGSPDCPKKKTSDGGGGGGGSDPPKPAGSGKWAAPKSGEPHTKTIDGKEKHYCSTC